MAYQLSEKELKGITDVIKENVRKTESTPKQPTAAYTALKSYIETGSGAERIKRIEENGITEVKKQDMQKKKEDSAFSKIKINPAKVKRDTAQKQYDDYVKSDEYKQRVIANDQKARAEAAAQLFLNPGQPMPQPKVIQDEKEMQLRAARDQAEAEYNAAEDRKVIEDDLEAITGLSNEERRQLERYAVGRDVDYYESMNMAQNGFQMGRAQREAASLIDKYGQERVDEMANSLSRQNNDQLTQQIAEMGQKHGDMYWGVPGSIASVAANTVGGIMGTMDYIKELGRNDQRFQTLDPYAMGNVGNVYAGAVRGQVQQNIEGEDPNFWRKAGSIAYQGAMSAADSIARAYLGGGALGGAALAATGSFSQTMADASKQGATPAQAALLATTTAGIEALSEKIPLDNLIRTAKGTGAKTVIANVLRQMGIEATTEEISLLGTVLAEAAILQEKSTYQQDVLAAIGGGATPEDAILQASKNVLNEALNTLLVSAVSGGVSSLSGSYADARGMFAEEQAQNNPVLNRPDNAEQAAQTAIENNRARQERMAAEQAVQEAVQPQTEAQPVQAAQQQQPVQQAPQQPQQPQTQQSLTDIYADMFTQMRENNGQNQQKQTGESVEYQDEFADWGADPNREGVENPMADRKYSEVGKRDVKAYMYENPAVKPFYQEQAAWMLSELSDSTKGERTYNEQLHYDSGGEKGWSGTKRHTSDSIAELLDQDGMTYEQIEKGLNAIINDNGQENNAISKRIEFIINDRLMNGYTDFYTGQRVQGNAEYLNLLRDQQSTPTTDMQTESAEGGQIKGTGAAEQNFSGVAEYENMLSDDNVQRQRPNAARDVEMPKFDSDGRRVTEFAKNVSDAEVTPEPLADAVKSLVGDKKLSFDTRSNQESLNNAAEAIKTQGDTAVIADIHAHAEAKTVKDGDIEKGLVLYAQYANDPNPKSQETAAQLIVDMAALANMSGRNLQLFSLMQRLTPEGRIKVLKKDLARSIKQINAGRSKNKQVDLSKPGVMTDKKAVAAVNDAKKYSEKQVKDASDKIWYKGGKVEIEGNQANEPFVFEYAQKVGEALAKGLENSQKKKPQKTFFQTMTSELKKFASEKMPAARKEKQLTSTELLRDYIQNQDFYAEAWSAAQETLRKKHANDPEFQEFINSGIGVDANANPQNKIMAKALATAAMETGETTEMLRKQQALGITGMSENIANKLINDTGATGEMAQTIRDAAYKFVQNRINEADSKENAKTYDAGYFVDQAMRDIKQSMSVVAKKNTQGRAAMKQSIIDSLTRKYKIGLTDATHIAEIVGDTFDQKAQDQARKLLEQKFGEREKKQTKSAGQMIEEYANLGAYGQESQYSEQATESFLRAAMRDIGTTISDLAKSGKADKEAVRAKIAQMITERHGIDKADATHIAGIVVDQMNRMTEAQAKKILAQKFADRPERNKKTSQQIFEELANLGAFDVGSTFSDAASKKVFGDDVDVHINEELAQKFLDAKTDKEKEAAMDEIYKDVASRIKPTLGEVWDAWRNLAMLGSFKTHERNILSTAAYQPYQSVKRAIGTVLEKTLRIDPEQRTKSVIGLDKKSHELLAWAKADAKSDSTQNLMQRSGTTGNEARSAIQEYRKILPGILDKASKKNMELMENADMRFKKREYAISLASFLKARGYTAADIQNGNIPNGVLDEGRQIAVREAMKATFNDSNKFSDAAVRYMKANERDGSKILNIVKKGTIPFLRTPANVVVRAVENNPLTMVVNLATAKKDIESGRKSAADVLDSLSANLAGGVGVALGALLGSGAFENVELIGSIEDEEELREGAQEYSVRIGEKYYNVAWLAPAMIPLFLGANLARNNFFDGLQDADGWDIAKAFVDLGADTLEPILELSMLSSLNNAVQKFTSEEDPGDGAMAVFLNSLTSYVQQGLPTIVGQAEQATETEKSSTFVNTDNKLEEIMKSAVSYASKRIPGVDLYQTKKLDEWGNVVKNEGDSINRIVDAFLNPFTVTTRKKDAVIQEISRLNRAGQNVSPDYFSKTVSYIDKDGNGHDEVRLTEEQYQTLAQTQGQTARKLLEDMFKSASYKGMDDEQKAEAIKTAYQYARMAGEIAAIGKDEHTGYDQSWMYDVEKGGANEILRRELNSGINTAMGNLDNAWDKGYNEERFVQEMEDMFRSYQNAPASMKKQVYAEASGTAKKYIEVRDNGLSHTDALAAIKNVATVKGTGSINKDTGKPTVRDIDRRQAIANTTGLSEKEIDIMMKAYMADYDPNDESPETTEFKYQYAREELGLSPKEYAATYRAYLDSDKKAQKIKAIRALGYDYKTANALYKLYYGRMKKDLIKMYG